MSRNPKVHYRTHKRPPPVSILGQPNPVHIPTSHLPEIRPNSIHPSTPRSPQWSLSPGSPPRPYTPPYPHPYARLVVYIIIIIITGRDSAVGMVTRYGPGSPEIESRWGARFSAPVQTGPGVHPVSYTMGTGFFQGVKGPGRGVDHPHTSSAEVEERVEQYIYFPSGPLWPALD